jgi:hypothetical protein
MCRECCCNQSYLNKTHGYRRRFLTKSDKLEKLKKYTEDLKKELDAVRENIQELEK